MFKYEVPRVPRLAVDGMDGGEGSGLVSELRVQIWVPKLLSRVTLIKLHNFSESVFLLCRAGGSSTCLAKV